MRDGVYELDLVLRNNITTEEFPLGVYHPHQELHHIKKENIGLIEVMGLAVLPSRLKEELNLLAKCIVEGKDIRDDETIEKHADWAEAFLQKYEKVTKENVEDILKKRRLAWYLSGCWRTQAFTNVMNRAETGLNGSLPVWDLTLVHNRKAVRRSDGLVFVITSPLRYSRVGVKGNIVFTQ